MSNKSGVGTSAISLPKGGGATKGIGEKFQPDLFTGTANFSVPIALSPGRGGFGPKLTLQYSSGNGNGPFGLGWTLSVPQVSRKTEKGLPRYADADTFLLSGSEDLVKRADRPRREVKNYYVSTYRPRVEGLFVRIEKWELKPGAPTDPKLSNVFWKITTKENIISIYGRTPQAVLINPNSQTQIFQWMLELTYDAKGNYIRYEYKKEDGAGVPEEIYEHNRSHDQIYLKRIHYGNLTPFDAIASDPVDGILIDQDCFFLVVFDYGEHGAVDRSHELITADIYKELKPWDCRPDPFSTYRARFEIRTHRRCKRVLMFHRKIPGENDPVLVKSTDFLHQQNNDTLVTMLTGVTHRGYRKAEQVGNYESEEIALSLGEPGVKSTIYEIKSIPRLDFGYTAFTPEKQRYAPFQAKGEDMPPNGLNDPNFALVDLFGTGLPDVLNTTPTGYYYWRNLGDGLFDRRQVLKNMPAGVTLDQDGVDFGDMAGDGQADLLVHTGQLWGFYEATNKGGWKTFHRYASFPSFNITDPNVRLVDLTGDGKSDALRTDQHHFSWFPCLGEEGFGKASVVERIRDIEEFPDIYFDEPFRRVHLEDMTGDGLKDIVLMLNGRIDYWPNLGYGRFGKRITMKDTPNLGYNFDPKRLFLVDIDGGGPADLVYVESGKVRFWFNRSGNGWSKENEINGTPTVTDVDSIQFADMFGNGSSGIMWSTGYRGPQQSNYLFLDFTGGVKPYVLTEITNNMGATIRAKYKSSTHFYLEDLKKREHWVTTVPFPIQVLEKIEIIDHIAKSKLVSRYSYHHGYFDGCEREFRGFGRVDQLDTEIFDEYKEPGLFGENNKFERTTDQFTHVPPIFTKNWFHTGAYEEEQKHLQIFREEYYNGDPQAFKAHSKVEVGDAPFEAYRALRGANLRTEVFALDNSSNVEHPYTVTENGFIVKLLQPKNTCDYAVFFSTKLESFTYHYERNPTDPLVSHKITHRVDGFGNILKSLDIVYPRRNPDCSEQGKFFINYENNQFINQDNPAKPYFVSFNYEAKKTELINIGNLPNTPIRPEEVQDEVQNDIQSLDIDNPNHNLFSHSRNYYDGPAYKGLTLGQIGLRGLITRKEMIAFKKGQIAAIYGTKVKNDDLRDNGYSESQAEPDNWWVQTQRIKFGDRSKFFMPEKYLDPMGSEQDPTRYETTISYDQFFFLPIKTTGPIKTEINSENDYYILSPFKTIDLNDNHTQIKYNPLGKVISTNLMGKIDQDGNIEGDPIEHATIYFDYNYFNYWKSFKLDPNDIKPNFMRIYNREEHFSVDPNAKYQEVFIYSDGFGREIQSKIQAEPEPTSGDSRWVGSGWKIYNNKGWVVEAYEPFFSSSFDFEDNNQVGVSAKITFDPLGRSIHTKNPDGSIIKIVFSSWYQTVWDSNDTITDLKNTDGTYINEWYGQKSNGTPQEINAAEKALEHKDTPTTIHLDPLRREILRIEDNGSIGKYITTTEFDIQGNITKIIDPRGNSTFEYKYNLLNNLCYRWQSDSGVRSILCNAVDKTIKKWDSRNHLVETKYDELNRSTELWVTQLIQNKKRLVEKIVYGNNIPNAKLKNLKGQIYQQFDGAGLVTSEEYDFKGNLLKKRYQILKNYKTSVDWNAVPIPEFTDDPLFRTSKKFDALNRLKEFLTPDDSLYIAFFNKASLLEKIDVYIRGATNPTHFVLNINYNAKGQRQKVEYANGVITSYRYDPTTFRLISLHTYKNGKDFQKYRYTYDPVGNITSLEDLASQSIFFGNTVVSPNRTYLYDPLYRLIGCYGREHAGQVPEHDHEDIPLIPNIPHPNDPNALRSYKETYKYDESGNIKEIDHKIWKNHIWTEGWIRDYDYFQKNNKLEKTTKGRNNQPNFFYEYDTHGNNLKFLDIKEIHWDFKDQMVYVEKSGGTKIFYLYDSDGQRKRMVRENNYNVKLREKIYIDGFEIYREFTNNNIKLERETLHVLDDKHRIALIETLTRKDNIDINNPKFRIRFQLGDHLGSSVLEINENGKLISSEEYYPFGMTSYHSTSSTSQVSKKIYRYCEKELDNMTGFYYFGARYYAPWLGRWISCDPLGAQSGLNLYEYAQNNPINIIDIEGMVGETIFTKPVRDWARRGGARAAKRLSKIKTKLKYLSQRDYAKRAKELGLPVPKGGKLSKKNYLKRLLEEAEAIKRVTDKEKFHQAVREIVEVVDKQIVALGGKGMADGGSAAGIAVSLLMAYKTRKAKNMLLGGGTALLISLSTETSKAEGEIENIRLDNIGVHLERQIEVMNSPVRWDLVCDLFDVSRTYTRRFTITHEGVIYNWNINSPYRLEEDLRPRIYLGPGSLFNYTPKSSSPTNFIDLSSLEPAQEKEAYDIKGLSCFLGRICQPM